MIVYTVKLSPSINPRPDRQYNYLWNTALTQTRTAMEIKLRPVQPDERERGREGESDGQTKIANGSRASANEKVLRSCCGSAAGEGFLLREIEN